MPTGVPRRALPGRTSCARAHADQRRPLARRRAFGAPGRRSAASSRSAARAASGATRARRPRARPDSRGRARCGTRTGRSRRRGGSPRTSRGRSARRHGRSRALPRAWRSPTRRAAARTRRRPVAPTRRATDGHTTSGRSSRKGTCHHRASYVPQSSRSAPQSSPTVARAASASRSAGTQVLVRGRDASHLRDRRLDRVARRAARGVPACARAARARSPGRGDGARRAPARRS